MLISLLTLFSSSLSLFNFLYSNSNGANSFLLDTNSDCLFSKSLSSDLMVSNSPSTFSFCSKIVCEFSIQISHSSLYLWESKCCFLSLRDSLFIRCFSILFSTNVSSYPTSVYSVRPSSILSSSYESIFSSNSI